MRITESNDVISFAVRVQPRASRNEIAGECEDGLKVRLTAPPVDDRANVALRRMLATCLNVPLAAVRIAAGLRSRVKRVEVQGVTAEDVRALPGVSSLKSKRNSTQSGPLNV